MAAPLPAPTRQVDPVVVEATNRDTALLTDVRAARHEGYDRVVFEFRNAVPGYDVRYGHGLIDAAAALR